MATARSLLSSRLRTPAVLAPAGVFAFVLALHAQLPPQVVERDARMAELAAGAAQRGPATPIPLSGSTTRVVGAVYDQYLLGVVIGRAQIAAGQTPDPKTIAAHPLWQSRGTVVVAYPIDCEGRPNQPLAIRWTTQANVPVEPGVIGGPARGPAAQSILPGVAIPEDALVVSFRNAFMIAAAVEVDYANPVCRGAARTASLPLQSVPSLTIARGFNANRIPAHLASVPSPSTVRLEVLLDATGRVRSAQHREGPVELGSLAIDDIMSRTYPPATINGVGMPGTYLVAYVYTTNGDPTPPAPFTPPSQPGVTSRSSTVMTAVPSAPSAPVPPAPAGLLDTQLARIAAEIGAKSDAVPVPLDAAGPVVHGVIFDRFLVGVVRARAAFKAGAPIDPGTAPQTLVQGDLVAVAYPLTCNGASIAPSEVAVATGGTRPGPLRATGRLLTGPALAELLPGVVFPAGAVGRAFAGGAFSQNLEVRVTYSAPPCGSTTSSLTFPIQWTRGQSLPHMSTTKLPAGSALPSPTQVRLRGMVDPDGAYRFPTLAEGAPELEASASVVASQWKFQPYRANGVPSPMGVITTLTFTTTGMPEMPPPGAAMPGPGTPPPPPGAAPPAVITSSTIGGRSSTDFTTPDVPGLTSATSKCEVSTDATYGLSPANPIKVGGSFQAGPGRARAYLSSLRGPAGQGLRVVRVGSTMAPDKQTILDLYEITSAGVATPVRLFVSQYQEEQLKAPIGFSCSGSLPPWPLGR
jgi:hypothetical protein